MQHTVSYQEMKHRFKPLDLLLFRGTDFISNTVSIVSRLTTGNGDFSHVGLLVNKELLPTVDCLVEGKWYVWESTFTAVGSFLENFSDGIPTVTTGKGKLGVQIRDIELVVKNYTASGGKIAWAALKNNPWTNRSHRKVAKEVSAIHKIVGNRTYEIGCFNLAAAAFPCLRKPRDMFNSLMNDEEEIYVSWDPILTPGEQKKIDDLYKRESIPQVTSLEELEDIPIRDNLGARIALEINNQNISGWLFCSELVALVYQQLGLIDPKLDPQNAIPVDFLGCDIDGIPRLVDAPIYLH